jgi:TolA-binding protein
VLLLTASALAQDQRGSGNFLDNLFNRGEQTQSRQQSQSGRMEQADPSDMTVRLDRMESALRQLTGTLEQLQYRNQQLEAQLKRRTIPVSFSAVGSRGGLRPGAGQRRPLRKCAVAPSDVARCFRSNATPQAPGAPRAG